MGAAGNYHSALMSAVLPELVDAWRMVAQRRCFEGTLPLSQLPRLVGTLADAAGECRFALEFGRDEFDVGFVEIRLEAGLPLTCQRTLERFVLPVSTAQRLGLVRDESEEAALPPDYEPALLDADGQLRPLELIEDELILALPLVPVKPGTEATETEVPPTPDEVRSANPFAALAALKPHKD